MISKESLIRIGQLVKPHGIKGEITASVDYDLQLRQLSSVIVDIDGIFVPFFINNERPKSSETVLISIDGIDSEADAKEMCGRDYYALRSDVDIQDGLSESGGYLSDFIGYVIMDKSETRVGVITDYDDSTENILFIVTDNDGRKIFIPVAEELISNIDPEKQTITMNLPDGILDIA